MELIQAVSDYACGLALSYGGAMSGAARRRLGAQRL